MNKINFIYILLLFNNLLWGQKIPIIIDADTANEVDDLFAISGALTDSKFNIIGLTASQFNTSPLASSNTALESKIINDEILDLFGKNSIPSLIGSHQPINDINLIKNSQASSFIIKKAQQFSKENPLHIVILGSCTNVATAIIMSPEIIPNIKVYYLGFWHDIETNVFDKNEFNSRNDPLAMNFLLNKLGLDLTIMTATTSQHLIYNRNELDMNFPINSLLGKYLKDRWDTYNRWWTDNDKQKKQWIMWDVALIESIANNTYAELKIFDNPKENINRKIKIYTSIDVLKIKNRFWNKIKNFYDD